MKILFVCTGNTCRSPMAQAVFNNYTKINNIDAVSFSAGLFPENSGDISQNAKIALADMGIEFSHTPCCVSEELIESCDCVFGLTQNHVRALESLFPQYKNKIFAFPVEISDPYGMDISHYKNCLETINKGIEKIITKFELK